MRKYFIFTIMLLLFAFTPQVKAEDPMEFVIEEVVLEEILLDGQSYESLNISIEGKTIEPADLTISFDKMHNIPKYNSLLSVERPLYTEQKFSYGQERKFLGTKFGVKYDNKVARSEFEQLRTLYGEYQKNNFSFLTSYRVNSFAFVNKDRSYKWQLSPKYKITDHIALKYVHTGTDEDTEQDIMFSFTPLERLNFDVGVGGKKYVNKDPSSARFLFSTGFEF